MQIIPIYQLNNFQFQYPFSQTVIKLNGIVEIYAGNIVLITGHSGIGKSTLLYALKGLIPHVIHGNLTGQILYKNKNILHLDQRARSQIGVLLQNPNQQIITNTVYEELAFALENIALEPAIIHERIQQYVKLFSCENLLSKPIAQLSTGQKQKISIIAILLTNPDVILLDEPTAFLDPIATNDFINIFKQLISPSFHKDRITSSYRDHEFSHKKNYNPKTVIIIEHNTNYLRGIINRHLHIDHNGIISEKSIKTGDSINGKCPMPTLLKDTAQNNQLSRKLNTHKHADNYNSQKSHVINNHQNRQIILKVIHYPLQALQNDQARLSTIFDNPYLRSSSNGHHAHMPAGNIDSSKPVTKDIISTKAVAQEAAHAATHNDVSMFIPAIRNLNIYSQTITAITGANGIGKTTFLATLAKLNQKQYQQNKTCILINQHVINHGASTLFGNSIANNNCTICMANREQLAKMHDGDTWIDIAKINWRKYYKKVALLWQNPDNHFLFTTVGKEVNHNKELLATVGLDAQIAQNPFTLSEGQKRRLSLAILWQQDALLYLLDEPTFGQDENSKILLLKQIRTMVEQAGKAFIIVSHDQQFLQALGAQIIDFTSFYNN